MNFKTTYILAAILATILILLGTAVFLGPESPGGEAFLLPSTKTASTKVDADDIDKVVIERSKPADGLASMTLNKTNGQWTIESPDPFGPMMAKFENWYAKSWRLETMIVPIAPNPIPNGASINPPGRWSFRVNPRENHSPLTLGTQVPARQVPLFMQSLVIEKGRSRC